MVSHDSGLVTGILAVSDEPCVIPARDFIQSSAFDQVDPSGILHEKISHQQITVTTDVLYVSDRNPPPSVGISKSVMSDDQRLTFKARHRVGIEKLILRPGHVHNRNISKPNIGPRIIKCPDTTDRDISAKQVPFRGFFLVRTQALGRKERRAVLKFEISLHTSTSQRVARHNTDNFWKYNYLVLCSTNS